mgnify:CR=1 FL=1
MTSTAPDYLPAAGHDALLPCYDLLSRVFGIGRYHRRLVELADLGSARDVLDIGCGTGNLTFAAKRAWPQVQLVGLDPDPRALARAQKKVKGRNGIRFERGYAQDLPYADATFDRVLSAFMLHHLPDAARPALAGEVLRVLRPGGALYLVDIAGHLHPSDGMMARHELRSRHIRHNVGDGVPRLLGAAGFDCVELDSRAGRIGRATFYRATKPQ